MGYGLSQLGPITAPAALGFYVPGYKRPTTTVEVALDSHALPPKRLPNGDLRTREYLTEAEVERLMTAARKNRWGHRDTTMILVAYRHGLRGSAGL